MADLEKIAEDLSALTVLEAAELSKLLEEKWGVSAAAPVAVAAAPAAGGDAGAMSSYLGAAAVMFAMINVAGGYLVTNRMLSMFKKKDANQPGGKS